MTILEYSRKFLENDYHRMHDQSDFTVDKDTFIQIIRCARQVLQNNTFGDVNRYQGRETLFRVKINENSFYNVHADTKISALKEMYSIYNDNKNCQFSTKNGPDGGQVLSNRETYIEGLYIYLI